jgi:hypothetical protein
MSVDLVRLEDAERCTMTNQQWAYILSAAEENGWNPSGTVKSDDNGEIQQEWDGSNYGDNDGQIVESGDAENLAAACRVALEKAGGDSWKNDALCTFLEFAAVSEGDEIYYPGFEIW